MDERDWLAHRFEENRTHLQAVAYRMLGSLNDTDDAVQEAWLRLSRSDTSGVENLGGWLTTVVGLVCLDMLPSRKSRREEPLDEQAPNPVVSREDGNDPEHQALLADTIGPALHDMFAVPFDEIAPIVGRSPSAARQLASRARRRVQGSATVPGADLARQREVVDAFLAASRDGDFDALLAMLDPDVVLRADSAAVQAGASREILGAPAVSTTFAGRARAAQPALVNGAAGAVWAPGGRPRVVFSHAREDRRNRPNRQPRAPEPARPGGPQQLMSQPTLRLGSAPGAQCRSGTARSALARMSARFCVTSACRYVHVRRPDARFHALPCPGTQRPAKFPVLTKGNPAMRISAVMRNKFFGAG